MTAELLTQSGEIVGGVYRLGSVVHHSEASALYETEFGEDGRPAVIAIRRADTPDAVQLPARWRSVIELAHPNLIRLYAAGSSVVNGVPIVYVVMERADESLAGVLAERALSEVETREMLAPTLAALRYLHKNGYAHCNLKPSNILAVGDLLKVSSDSATRVEDGGEPTEDMWALGSVIVEAFTRQPPKIEEELGPYILRDAPEPYTEIVRHCLVPDPAKRWTADRVATRLDLLVAAPVSPAAPPPAQDSVKKEAQGAPRPLMQAPLPRVDDHDEAEPTGRNWKWIFAGVAALVLIGVLMGLGRKNDSAPVPVASTPVVHEKATVSPFAVPAGEVPAPAVNPAPKEVTKTVPEATDRRATGWSVVVASYALRSAAENRERELAQKWPKFKVSVFEPKTEKAHYLVVIGRNLSEDEAEALRQRAVSAGLPRDTYIKRFL
jgi:eukaryotic-like serine/threonine-protein kinase